MVSVPRAEVPFTDSIGRQKGILIIVPTGKGQLFKLEPKEVREFSEELVQLVEGQRYEYEFSGHPGLRIRSSDIVKPSSLADLRERSGSAGDDDNSKTHGFSLLSSSLLDRTSNRAAKGPRRALLRGAFRPGFVYAWEPSGYCLFRVLSHIGVSVRMNSERAGRGLTPSFCRS